MIELASPVTIDGYLCFNTHPLATGTLSIQKDDPTRLTGSQYVKICKVNLSIDLPDDVKVQDIIDQTVKQLKQMKSLIRPSNLAYMKIIDKAIDDIESQ